MLRFLFHPILNCSNEFKKKKIIFIRITSSKIMRRENKYNINIYIALSLYIKIYLDKNILIHYTFII